MRDVMQAHEHRRSYYNLKKESPIADDNIIALVQHATRHTPSPYNMQNQKAVLLLGKHHDRLWEIVLETLREVAPPEQFAATVEKVSTAFAAGYGTVMYFNDDAITEHWATQMPLYRANFELWSQHSLAMLQHSIWVMLEDAGFGASLQHYNPLINKAVAAEWGIPENWNLSAQMPFGVPNETPGEKEFHAIGERVKIFR